MSRPVGRASGVSPMPVSESAAGFRGLRKIHKKVPPALHGEAPCFLPGWESSFPVLFPEPGTLPGGEGRGRPPSSCAVFSRILGKAQKKGGRQNTCLTGCSSLDVLFGLGLGGFFRLTFRNVFLTCPEAHVIHFLSAYADKRFAGQRRILLESVFFLVGSGIKAVRAQMTDGEHAE